MPSRAGSETQIRSSPRTLTMPRTASLRRWGREWTGRGDRAWLGDLAADRGGQAEPFLADAEDQDAVDLLAFGGLLVATGEMLCPFVPVSRRQWPVEQLAGDLRMAG